MLAWRSHQDGLCRCGQPKAEAWHPDNDGWYESPEDELVTCHACTALEKALNPKADPVRYPILQYTRETPLPPWPTKRSA